MYLKTSHHVKRIGLVGVSIALILACLGIVILALAVRLNNGGWRTLYSRRIGGYAINYPADWSFDVFASGFHGDREQIALLWQELPFPVIEIRLKELDSPTLQSVATWGKHRIEEQYAAPAFQYEIVSEQTVMLGQNTVFMREYIIRAGGSPPLRKKDAYISRSEDGLIITLTAWDNDHYEELEALFDEIVATFRTISTAVGWSRQPQFVFSLYS